jgi:hypothetical protein
MTAVIGAGVSRTGPTAKAPVSADTVQRQTTIRPWCDWPAAQEFRYGLGADLRRRRDLRYVLTGRRVGHRSEELSVVTADRHEWYQVQVMVAHGF